MNRKRGISPMVTRSLVRRTSDKSDFATVTAELEKLATDTALCRKTFVANQLAQVSNQQINQLA